MMDDFPISLHRSMKGRMIIMSLAELLL